MRSGFLESLRRLGPTLLRWPAGPGALDYEWRRGVGPRAERPPRAALAAEGGRFFPAPNDFGTDEFVALCREVGVEAMLVASPAASASSVADWLDYCNGEPTSRMGQVRASNGHQRPHQVRLWMVAAGPKNRGAGGENSVADALVAAAPGLRVFLPRGAAAKATCEWLPLRVSRRDLRRQLAGLAERLKAARASGLAAFLVAIEAETAVEGAATLVALATQAGPEVLATVPLTDRQEAVGLLSIEGQRVSETPLGRAFRLLRDHTPRKLLEARTTAAEALWALVGLGHRQVILWAVNTAARPRGLEVSDLPLDGARAGEHQWTTEGGKAVERRTVRVEGGRLRWVLPPRSVNVLAVPTD